MAENEIQKLINLILKKVTIVPENILDKYREEAVIIIGHIDPDDVLFIACGLAYPDSIIWSDDKKLKKQSRIRIQNTSEILKVL